MTAIGNDYMGMRGNFEEGYSGDSLQGTYLAGVGSLIRRVLVGGRTDIQSTLVRFLTHHVSSTWNYD